MDACDLVSLSRFLLHLRSPYFRERLCAIDLGAYARLEVYPRVPASVFNAFINLNNEIAYLKEFQCKIDPRTNLSVGRYADLVCIIALLWVAVFGRVRMLDDHRVTGSLRAR